MENSAVQFCARKVSAVAGDMRKALDVCRRAVEVAQSEARSQTVLRISGEKLISVHMCAVVIVVTRELSLSVHIFFLFFFSKL